MDDRDQSLSLERAKDRFPGYLLPPRASLLVAHDEVLVIDSGQMKVKWPPVNCCLPHQTGVTERSISGHDRSAADHVMHQMVVGHLADRIGYGFPFIFHRQDHIRVCDEPRVAGLR